MCKHHVRADCCTHRYCNGREATLVKRLRKKYRAAALADTAVLEAMQAVEVALKRLLDAGKQEGAVPKRSVTCLRRRNASVTCRR